MIQSCARCGKDKDFPAYNTICKDCSLVIKKIKKSKNKNAVRGNSYVFR